MKSRFWLLSRIVLRGNGYLLGLIMELYYLILKGCWVLWLLRYYYLGLWLYLGLRLWLSSNPLLRVASKFINYHI